MTSEKGEMNVKRDYESPIAEMIEFDYSQTIVASKGGGHHGDVGMGVSHKDKGCDKEPGHNADHNPGHECDKD